MARSRTRAGVAVGLAVTLVACTADAPAPEAEEPTTDAPEEPSTTAEPEDEVEEAAPLEEVWSTTMGVFSGPTEADDDTVLVHVARGGRLYLVGFDLHTGEERWRQEASPGEVVTGIDLSPDVVDGHPVYFRPHDAGNLFAQLVVADATTGEDITVSEPLLFGAHPSACDDDPRAVCLTARSSYEESYRWQRLELDGSGTLRTDDARPEGTRSLGARGLLDIREDDTEYLAVVSDGEELWRREVSAAIGPGFSSSYGWGWSFDEPTDRYIGALGKVRDHDPDGVDTVDLSDRRVVAIDRTTGETLWTEDGVDHLCGYVLNVPTDGSVASTAAGDGHVSHLPVPVRCRLAGTVSFDNRDPDAEAIREGISVVLEGFDPATGATTWAVTPDDPGQVVRGIRGEDDPLVRADTTGVVLRIDGADTVVDLATGRTRPAEDDEVFWCAGPEPTFDYREPYYVDDRAVTRRSGQERHALCDASGEPLAEAGAAPSTVPNGIGVRVGDLTVVATPDGLRAYRGATPD